MLDALLTLGEAHGRSGRPLEAKGVLIHYVGNAGSTGMANRNYFENGSGGLGVSAHYVIGLDGEVLRLVPENEQAAHAGKSYKPEYNEMARTNNARYIGIECCHPDASGRFNEKTEAAVIALTADICRRHGFDIGCVKRHYDVTGKSCPLYYVNNATAWDDLVHKIKAALSPGRDVGILYNGVRHSVAAENLDGSLWLSISELAKAVGDIKVPLRATLEGADYTISYRNEDATVVVEKHS